jgi:hypothetical protein
MLHSIRSVFSLRSTGRSVNSDNSEPIYMQRTYKVSGGNNSSGRIAMPADVKANSANNTAYEIDRV